jgi:hypothetical protein
MTGQHTRSAIRTLWRLEVLHPNHGHEPIPTVDIVSPRDNIEPAFSRRACQCLSQPAIVYTK